MTPPENVWQWIQWGGVLGLALTGLWAFLTRRLHPHGELVERLAEAEARLDEMRADRDWWRAVATRNTPALEALTDVATRLAAGSPEVRR